MKKTVFLLFLFAAAQAVLMAGTFNIDKSEEIDLSGIERIRFVMEGPRCMMCLQTGSFEYSFSGRRSGGTVVCRGRVRVRVQVRIHPGDGVG